MTSLLLHLLLVWALAAIVMIFGWRWQVRHSNAGIVDVLWSSCLGCSGVLLAALGHGAIGTRVVLALCVALWGARLASHLWSRVSSEAEDGRYRYLRSQWPAGQWRWVALFQFQAFLVPLFSIPFAVVADNPLFSPAWTGVAIVVFAISLWGENIADRQLHRFRSNPANKGTTCREGLWRYSRHPNYFFEWLHWVGYLALAVGAPHQRLALAGPIVMYVFLRWISGVPFTEMQALRSRGDDYRRYQAETSMLIPWPPRRPMRGG